jgi:hypothetical protein
VAAAPAQKGLVTVRADAGGWRRFLPKFRIKVLHRDGAVLFLRSAARCRPRRRCAG